MSSNHNYEIKALDNNYLTKAITLFRENKKWAIVRFLADQFSPTKKTARPSSGDVSRA